jgi:hypothetical protein
MKRILKELSPVVFKEATLKKSSTFLNIYFLNINNVVKSTKHYDNMIWQYILLWTLHF